MQDLDLTPQFGLTDCHVRFAGLDVVRGPGGAAVVRFDFRGKNELQIGTLNITVGPQPSGTVDAMIAEGYSTLVDVLRQWLAEADAHHKVYAGRDPSGTSGT